LPLKIVKSTIQNLFLGFGYKVVKSKEIDQIDKFRGWFSKFNFHSVIDIGANEGQFAQKIRDIMPNVQIHSFEPIPDVCTDLKLKFSHDNKFSAYNTALGNENGVSIMTLNESSAASSLLKLNDEAKAHFSFLKESNDIQIKISKLEDIDFQPKLQKPYLVKIDVQGFELEVIRGGTKILKDAEVILVEVSFRHLYEKQVLFDDVYQYLVSIGFMYAGNLEQLISPNHHEIVQADAIFVRK
jgi:FkbM family methyltransferase